MAQSGTGRSARTATCGDVKVIVSKLQASRQRNIHQPVCEKMSKQHIVDQSANERSTKTWFARKRRVLRTRGDDRGFTLLELLVVLAILGLLVGLVAPAVLHQLGSAKEKVAHQSIERLENILDMYKLDVGSYPTTEQGLQALIVRPSQVKNWSGPYLKGNTLPKDPWDRTFLYRNPSRRQGFEYDLYSLGPTGGTDMTTAILNQ